MVSGAMVPSEADEVSVSVTPGQSLLMNAALLPVEEQGGQKFDEMDSFP